LPPGKGFLVFGVALEIYSMETVVRRVLGIAVAIAGIGWSAVLVRGDLFPEMTPSFRWSFALAIGAYAVARGVLAFVRKPVQSS
jgi:hypothetical protein